jgi:hypothetical protein
MKLSEGRVALGVGAAVALLALVSAAVAFTRTRRQPKHDRALAGLGRVDRWVEDRLRGRRLY